MKLVLHLVRKDLLRLRGWLLGWALVLIMPVLIAARVWVTEPPTEESWKVLEHLLGGLMWLQISLAYVVTLVLVQEDGLVGTRQFWRARPIASGRLALAKLVSVTVVLVGIPFVVLLPWWLWASFGVPEIAGVWAQWIVPMLLLALPAALIGSLTDSLARAILWTAALGAMALGAVAGFTTWHHGSGIEPGMVATRVGLAALLVIVVFALAIAAQYAYRQVPRTLLLVITGSAAAIAVSLWWPWQLITPFEPRPIAAGRAADVTLAVNQALRWPDGDRPPTDQVAITFVANGVPPDVALGGAGGNQTWRWREFGLDRWAYGNVRGPVTLFGMKSVGLDAETEQWQDEKNRQRRHVYRSLTPARWEVDVWSRVPRSISARMESDPPVYQARLWLQMLRPELYYEMPLTPDGRQAAQGFKTRLVRVERDGQDTRAVVADTAPLAWTGPWNPNAEGVTWFRLMRHRGYFLLNRRLGEFNGARDDSHSIWAQGVQVSWRRLHVGTKVIRDGKWVDKPGWLDGASLALATMKEEALFSRDVSVDRLRVEKFEAAARP